jgi:hypothetical protein
MVALIVAMLVATPAQAGQLARWSDTVFYSGAIESAAALWK